MAGEVRAANDRARTTWLMRTWEALELEERRAQTGLALTVGEA